MDQTKMYIYGLLEMTRGIFSFVRKKKLGSLSGCPFILNNSLTFISKMSKFHQSEPNQQLLVKFHIKDREDWVLELIIPSSV